METLESQLKEVQEKKEAGFSATPFPPTNDGFFNTAGFEPGFSDIAPLGPLDASLDPSRLVADQLSFPPSQSFQGCTTVSTIDPSFWVALGDANSSPEVGGVALESQAEEHSDRPSPEYSWNAGSTSVSPSSGSSSHQYSDAQSSHNQPSAKSRSFQTPAATNEAQDFADEEFIRIPELSLIKAHSAIIQCLKKLGHKIDVWNANSVSPFFRQDQQASIPPNTLLPAHYYPSPAQQQIKHHVAIDLLPWPSVRNRMLSVLDLPEEARPERARDDYANVTTRLVLDMKDHKGGLRVWGSDPFNGNNWEVGQLFYERWWWAFPEEIIENTNALRKIRGEEALRLESCKSEFHFHLLRYVG